MKMNDAIEGLSALSQTSRLGVFRLLIRKAPGGLSAGEIARHLSLPMPTLSFHLRTLSQAGLVRSERRGRYIRYHADFARMNALLHFLTEDCCGGRPEICGLVEPGHERAAGC